MDVHRVTCTNWLLPVLHLLQPTLMEFFPTITAILPYDGDDVAVADAAGGRDDGDEGRRSPSECSPLHKRPRRESAPGASARSGGPSPTRPLPAPSASAVVPTTSAVVLPIPAVIAPAPVTGPSTAVASSVGDATPRGRPKLPRKAEKMLVAFQAPVSRRVAVS